MKKSLNNLVSRRDFLKTSGQFVAVSALAGCVTPAVHVAENNTIQMAIIGCGGRGGGAVNDALSSPRNGPVKLVAMADVAENRLKGAYNALKKEFGERIDVPEDRKFLGFDAYKHAMDALKPGDVVILTTPPAFRWVHFTYAIQKGLNVFMEKPVTVDGPTTRRMLKLGEEAKQKNLKVGVGLMSRHSRALQELAKRIHNGEIGDLILQRGYRVHGPVDFAVLPKPADVSEVMYQVRHFHSFLWSGGGCFSDFNIHIIDHQCWMKNDWPIKAMGFGGRHYRATKDGQTYVDQNFDVYSVEYTYADGSTFIFDGRCITGCSEIYASFAHGSKGMAVVSKGGDCGQPSSTYHGQNLDRAKMIWESKVKPGEENPYKNEWVELIDAIRNDKPYNEVERGAKASLVTSMGRMAAHTGQVITFDQILNSDHEFAPDVDKLTADGPAPLQAGPDGKYPIPEPGIKKSREY